MPKEKIMLKNYDVAGVYREEKDISNRVTAANTSVGATIVRAAKGIANRVVVVTDPADYINKFGDNLFEASATDHPDAPVFGYGSYVAKYFLGESNELNVVRVVDSTDAYAAVELLSSFTSASNYAASAVDSSGVAAVMTSTDPDTETKIGALDRGIAGTSKLLVGAIGPGEDGNNFAITVETFNASCDWMLDYDEFPTETSAATVLASASNSGYASIAAIDAALALATGAPSTATLLPIAKKILKLNVYQKKTSESWLDINLKLVSGALSLDDLTLIETYYGTIGYKTDGDGKQLKITDVVNGVSQNIYVVTGANDLPVNVQPSITRLLKLAGGVVSKKNAIYDDGDTDTEEAWDFFSDKEYASVNILCNCDWSTTIKQKVNTIASTRMDCIATGQVGILTDITVSGLISKEAYGYRNASYMALYGGWDKIKDSANSKTLFVPKAVFAGMLMARNDRTGNTWDAPAGDPNGILPSLGQNKVFKFAEIGQLNRANINTSRWMKGVGHVVWAHKTAQRKASKLDRIGTRRLMIYIENSMELILAPFCFNITNDDRNRTRVQTLSNSFLATTTVGANPGANRAQCFCNEENNPAAVRENKQMIVEIFVEPADIVEAIVIRAIITGAGVKFEELVGNV
jgi:hypothetical protein